MKTDVLIIGAGLTGLILAKLLKRDNLVIEKSRGVGGRLATRRIQEMGFDHGAPYLEYNDHLLNFLKNHLSTDQVNFNEKGIYFSGGMTTLPKALAEQTSILKGTRVIGLKTEHQEWIVETDTQQKISARVVVLTAPVPQSLELLEQNQIPFEQDLKLVEYEKSLMALVITKSHPSSDLKLPQTIHSVLSMQERKLHSHGFVVRATTTESENRFHKSDEENLNFLLNEFNHCFKSPPQIEQAELKKWRYASPKESLADSFREVATNLYLIGDGFLFPDVRGAILSAEQLSHQLNLAF